MPSAAAAPSAVVAAAAVVVPAEAAAAAPVSEPVRWGQLGRPVHYRVMDLLEPIALARLFLASRRMSRRVLAFLADEPNRLDRSLEAARGRPYGCGYWELDGCWVQLGLWPSMIAVGAVGALEEDAADWLRLELRAGPGCEQLAEHLVEFGRNCVAMAGTEADPDSEATEADDGVIKAAALERLPTAAEAGAGGSRELTILTYGDALIKSKASVRQLGSQLEVNAKSLNGRGGGANTRCNALQDTRIIRNVASALSEGHGRLLLMHTIRKIEQEGLRCISVFCTKGRHRSVALAELLKARYYPQAVVKHLTIS